MVSALLSLAALPLVAQAIKIPMDNKMRQEPGLVRYPITVNRAPSRHNLQRRQQEVATHAQQSGFFYSIELQVGTPPQAVSVNFDTGSAELWINPVCSKSSDPAACQSYGRFNGSQTFVDTNVTNRVNYGTGFAQLEYGYDYIQIGSARVSQQLFGVATDSEFAVTGIMGAGPQLKGWKSDYPMILDNMVSQKFIKSRAFSLDIRSIESARGSVVFGGIDTKKFSGSLEKRPIIPAATAPDKLTRYWIYLDGISVTKTDGSNTVIFDQVNGAPVLLDSGYTVSSLSTDHFNKIKDAFPGVTPPPDDDQSGLYRVPCDVGQQNGTVNFKFGKTEISVPYNDFIWKQSSDLCVLGVTPDDKFPVLGDTFLRAAYVVYDMDNRNVHLANNEDCGSSLLAIGSGPDAVPSVQGDCGKKPASTTSSTLPVSTTTTANNTTTTAAAATSSPSSTTTTAAAPTTTLASIRTSIGKNSTMTTTTTTSRSTQSAVDSSSAPYLMPTGKNNSTTTSHTSTAAATGENDGTTSSTSTAAATGKNDDTTSNIFDVDDTNVGKDDYMVNAALATATATAGASDSTTSSTMPYTVPTGRNGSAINTSAGPRATTECEDNGDLASSQMPTQLAPPASKPFPTMQRYNTTTAVTYTSTFTSARLHTVTACRPHATDCELGAIITKTVIGYTTWCPAEDGKGTSRLSTTTPPAIIPTPAPTSQADMITSYYTTTKVHTVTSCPGHGPCDKGKVTTEVVTSTVYVCPETHDVLTFPLTHDCLKNEPGCKPGDKVVNTWVVHIEPHVVNPKPTPVPGCDEKCIMPPPVQVPMITKTGSVSQPVVTPPAIPQTPSAPGPAPTTTTTTTSSVGTTTASVGTINGITTAYTNPGYSACPTCTPQSSSPPVTAAAPESLRNPAVAGAMILGMLVIAVL
ncbi:hypothetical protein E4U54_001511 [Claviceps lovelessii]|nr:hypothetical protein E4U54_001511 [Claviceps lovelessii]